MNSKELENYIGKSLEEYYQQKIVLLEQLSLDELLLNKNIYLLSINRLRTVHDLLNYLFDDFFLEKEEEMLGKVLEDLAVFVCQSVFGGVKSRVLEGIDLEFAKNGFYYIVTIKSNPNSDDSQQVAKMEENFKNAEKLLLSQSKNLKVMPIHGCCYGIENQSQKRGYQKICGQEFWQLISDSSTLYSDIIELLSHKAREKNTEFLAAYARAINQFSFIFAKKYCDEGVINWEKIVEFTSKKHT